MRVVFLDIDGVLNRTGFRPDESVGLRSWIEPELARRLCDLLEATGAAVVLISDWRCNRTLEHLQTELTAAGVVCELVGVTPVLGQARWREIEQYMEQHDLDAESVVILDDGFDMGPLAARFVRTSPLNGLDDAAADAIRRLFSPLTEGRVMKTRNLDESAYSAIWTPKMHDVTGTATGPDVWPYVESVPKDDLCGHEIYDHFVEYVYRTDDDRFDHVLVMTKTKNVYLAVIVDLAADAVYGHHLLDLNELYGLKTKH